MDPKTAPQEQEKDFAILIYTGDYDGQKVKTVHGYVELDPKTQDIINPENELYMTKPLKGSRNPGSVFKVEIAERHENGKIKSWYGSGAKLLGFTHNRALIENEIPKWQAETKARKEAAVTLAESKRDLVKEALDKIKPEYERLSPAKRKALIAYIIYYMMS